MMYENVQNGDKFFVETKNRRGIYSVTNVTPKRFEVGGYTFNKKDGSQVGAQLYSHISIKLATHELEEQIKKEILFNKLAKELSTTEFKSLTLEQLQEVKDLLNSFNK